MKKAIALIVLYTAAISFPLVLAFIINPTSGQSFIYNVGKNFALVGITILSFQILLSGRFKWIERSFGFDVLIRYHRHMAILADSMLILHPVFLVIGGAGIGLVTSINTVWFVWLGRIALALLILNVLLSRVQLAARMKFEKWRVAHNILAPLIIIFGFVHSWNIGTDIWNTPMRILWIGLPVISIALFLFHRFIRPFMLSRRPYKVIDVKQEADKVWTIKMAPPEGREVFNYLPGQFQFITFKRGRGLPVEEHHWTISSSPTQKDYISTTIKALGDFTATIGATEVDDTATVHAPFGRFSHALHPDEKTLVFIAGGIGITPMMGMLRYLRDAKSDMPVVLLYGNRREDEIVFKDDIGEIAKGGYPALEVIHVLSNPDETWKGETGYIDRAKIEKHCGDLTGKGFYVSGPPGLVKATIRNLQGLNIDDKRIHMEIFSFLG